MKEVFELNSVTKIFFNHTEPESCNQSCILIRRFAFNFKYKLKIRRKSGFLIKLDSFSFKKVSKAHLMSLNIEAMDLFVNTVKYTTW